ncbi:mo25 family protein [Wolffia australiana]
MSFSFFKPSKARVTPVELARALKESLLCLDPETARDPKSREKAREDVDKIIVTMRHFLSGDGDLEPNQEQISQFVQEICKEDILSLFAFKLPVISWDARKDLAHCWGIFLRQTVGSHHCCVDYIVDHADLLDFVVGCYNNRDVAVSCGNVLRECIKYPALAKYMLESKSLDLFFKYVELPNFDIASDALATFKDLLTKNPVEVSEFLKNHYDKFFGLYERLLTSSNYVTRRQSLKLLLEFLLEPPNTQVMKRFIQEPQYLRIIMGLLKDKSKIIQISSFHIFKVFVANPNKPPEIFQVLAENQEELLMILHGLPANKGGDDDQFEEERDIVIKEIKEL